MVTVPSRVRLGSGGGNSNTIAAAVSSRRGFELVRSSSSSDSSQGGASSSSDDTTTTHTDDDDGENGSSSCSTSQHQQVVDKFHENESEPIIILPTTRKLQCFPLGLFDRRQSMASTEDGYHDSTVLPTTTPANINKKNVLLLSIATFAITSTVVFTTTCFTLQQQSGRRPVALLRRSNDQSNVGGPIRRQRDAPIVRPDHVQSPESIVFSTAFLGNNDESSMPVFDLPEMLGLDHEEEAYSAPDYANLELWNDDTSTKLGLQRQLQRHDDRYLDWYREDLMQEYFRNDGEENMWTYEDAYRHPVKTCNVPQAVYTPKPNCNPFHEFFLGEELTGTASTKGNEEGGAHFLGNGYYRDAWSMPGHPNGHVAAVLKQTRFERTLSRNRMQKIQTEALVMEALTSSPRISNIYGHCAFSVAVEAAAYDMEDSVLPWMPELQNKRGYIAQATLDQWSRQDAYPLNNFTAPEKLDILLQMAESMADAHGLPTGPVVSGDVAVDQWLRSADGQQRVVLNDFDSAVFLSYNLTSQQYCKYKSGSVGGYKTPEEHRVDYLDESVDIWKMGSLIFTVMTGLKPYYDAESIDDKWARIDAGELPSLDPRYETRSFIEGRLVEIMRRCHVVQPADRATIFEVVTHMRETKRLYNEQQQPAVKPTPPGQQRRLLRQGYIL